MRQALPTARNPSAKQDGIDFPPQESERRTWWWDLLKSPFIWNGGQDHPVRSFSSSPSPSARLTWLCSNTKLALLRPWCPGLHEERILLPAVDLANQVRDMTGITLARRVCARWTKSSCVAGPDGSR